MVFPGNAHLKSCRHVCEEKLIQRPVGEVWTLSHGQPVSVWNYRSLPRSELAANRSTVVGPRRRNLVLKFRTIVLFLRPLFESLAWKKKFCVVSSRVLPRGRERERESRGRQFGCGDSVVWNGRIWTGGERESSLSLCVCVLCSSGEAGLAFLKGNQVCAHGCLTVYQCSQQN